jgi:hypothetical protein
LMTARMCRGVHHFKNLPSFSVTHSMKMAISVRPEDRLHNVAGPPKSSDAIV